MTANALHPHGKTSSHAGQAGGGESNLDDRVIQEFKNKVVSSFDTQKDNFKFRNFMQGDNALSAYKDANKRKMLAQGTTAIELEEAEMRE